MDFMVQELGMPTPLPENTFFLPQGTTALAIQDTNYEVKLWVLVPIGEFPPLRRRLRRFDTGETINEGAILHFSYIGTVNSKHYWFEIEEMPGGGGAP